MSTIHDALKKVQDDMAAPNKPSEPSAAQPQHPHNPFNATTTPPKQDKPITQQENQPNNKNQKIFAIIIFILLFSLLGFGTTLLIKQNKIPLLTAQFYKIVERTQKTTPTQKAIPPQKKPSPIPEGVIRVQGIMKINNKQVALINNEIYTTGDSIEGNTIEMITKEEVFFIDKEGQKNSLKIFKQKSKQ